MRTPHLQAGLVGLVATLALLAGCAGGQGPLMGSREGGAASTICALMRPSARVYYGAPMRNEGTRAITVDRVVVTDATNVADIDLGFDHDGYTIGTAAFPTGLGELDIRPMLDSLRDTSGDVIAPGETVTLVLSPVPEVERRRGGHPGDHHPLQGQWLEVHGDRADHLRAGAGQVHVTQKEPALIRKVLIRAGAFVAGTGFEPVTSGL